ncbi:PH domain-containing protein [Spiractinospora alimapuensis]|nr:PH domain-containing protein [Spiractinospora alimapuensis]QVQ54691.1 PH domain-containing protein [Spiractinospora alimapuensis]
MVWRPRRIRVVMGVLAVAIMVTLVILAVILPPNWTIVDRVSLVLLGLVGAVVMGFLARASITATEDGLRVVNIIRTWILEWPEIVDVRMPEGEPWPTLDLADGTSIVAMGIQRSDGPRAQDDLAQLIALLHERGEAQEPEI